MDINKLAYKMWRRATEAAVTVSGVVAPQRCVVCGRALAGGEEFLCLDCLWAMPRTQAHRMSPAWLADMLARTQPGPRLASWFYYRSDKPYSNIITLLKFHDRPGLGRRAGAQFAREIKDDGFFDGIDLIVPIPIPLTKRIVRGYNQAAMIARGVSDATGIPVADILGEGLMRRSQVGLTAAQRVANIGSGRFSVRHADMLDGKHILLVDDVITTGSTIVTAARALRGACPALGRVSFLSLALTAT